VNSGGKRPIPVLGVLGGIASGKSTVSGLLARCGATVVDADRIGHQVLEMPRIKMAVRKAFGQSMFAADGSVNRSALAEAVFADPQALARLNGIVHPAMLARIREDIKEIKRRGEVALVVLDAAILMETGLDKELCDALLMVEADLETRRRRALLQRGWSCEQFRRRESAQMAVSVKKKHADFVIDNSGPPAQLERRVRAAWEEILRHFSEKPCGAGG